MTEEERIHRGILFSPADPALKAIKLESHKLSALYSRTFEDETEERARLLERLLGNHFFANYNLTVQDDAKVAIGDHVSFGPKVTIVTPVHPFVASERRTMLDRSGETKSLCYAKPVTIGNDVWVSAGVTICGGVTIGDGCVIGAGSVVTRDIPANSLAAGSPCKVIRPITEADSMRDKPEILADCRVIEPEE